MVILISIGFWALVLIVLTRLALIEWRLCNPRSLRIHLAAWGSLVIVGAALLMRPHEDIFGGQDTGAYPNMGARMERNRQFLYVDPLLALVPPESRKDFFYYDEGTMYPTEFGSGAVMNVDKAIAGNWFQPAMATAMVLPAAITRTPRAVLYVAPLFTLLTALALAALAALLIPHRLAGIATAICFLTSPIVIWHGRCPRPEIIAAFLLFSGATLVLHASRSRRWGGTIDIILGAACISLAPLFHVIAWSPALIASIIVTFLILSGRRDFLLYALVATVGFIVFLLQLTVLVDTYRLLRFVHPIVDAPRSAAALLIFALTCVTGLSLCSFTKRMQQSWIPRKRQVQRWNGAYILAVGLLAAILVTFMHAMQHRPNVHIQNYHFIHPTDLVAVLNMISIPTGIMALTGLLLLALRRPSRSRWETTSFLLFATIPSLLIGYLYDFFLVRYTLVTLLPLVTVGLAALITCIPLRRIPSQLALAVCTLAICSIGLRGRMHLITTVEYRGFVDFIEKLAEPLRQEKAILLCEYSRIASPLDHYSGIPTLGLHNERLNNYAQAELAWKGIMEKMRDRPAYFLTPFSRAPLSEHFTFELVDTVKYEGPRLIGRRWDLPSKEKYWGCTLRRYRVRLSEKDVPSLTATPKAFAFGFDPGNMGLRNFANDRTFNIPVMGKALTSDTAITIPLPTKPPLGTEVWLFVYGSADPSAQPEITPTIQGEVMPTSWCTVAPRWWLCRTTIPMTVNDLGVVLTLKTKEDGGFLTTARLVNGLNVTPLFDGWRNQEDVSCVTMNIDTRWARQGASFDMPKLTTISNQEQPCEYLCTLIAGPEEVAQEVTIGMGSQPSAILHKRIPTGKWLWEVWPLVSSNRRLLNVQIETDTTFDPRHKCYPKDLALLMGYAAGVPATLP